MQFVKFPCGCKGIQFTPTEKDLYGYDHLVFEDCRSDRYDDLPKDIIGLQISDEPHQAEHDKRPIEALTRSDVNQFMSNLHRTIRWACMAARAQSALKGLLVDVDA